MSKPSFIFFGSSKFSRYVLDTLIDHGYEPVLNITSAKTPLPALPDAEVFIVASFGKILPADIIYKPKYKTLNVHPSLLPKLRGPSPIQGAILSGEETGVTIMRMNEKMDEGPIVAVKKVKFENLPERYIEAEKALGVAGGELLTEILPKWTAGEIEEIPQNDSESTYTRMIRKEDADISKDPPETALKKIRAYEVWPRARIGELIVTEAHIEDGKLVLDKVIPPGKKEMIYADYLRGRH
ncbi:hypothetical protein KW796_01080 [Candidatus Parcubacteria bacterium]|nr:hypothetical protein [Candidatus Parcubacteria bacterium]